MPFVRSLSASLPVRHGMPGGGDSVSGRIGPGMRCPEACPIVASSWTPDTTVRTSDGRGLRTFRHRAWVQLVTTGGSRCWSRLGWLKASMRITVLSGQGQDVQAAWVAVAGWPGAWWDARRWRCPPLGRRRPDLVRTIG
jgi:hypothetical protein